MAALTNVDEKLLSFVISFVILCRVHSTLHSIILHVTKYSRFIIINLQISHYNNNIITVY